MKKYLFVLFLSVFVHNLLFAQSYFEANGIAYKILKESDEASAFGLVSVTAKMTGVYEGEITIPNGVKDGKDEYSDSYRVVSIAENAFQDSDLLTKVTLPISLESIGANAFKGCVNLETVVIPAGCMQVLSSEAFAFSGICHIELPNTITEIGKYAFFNCENLETISIPSTLQKLGYQAFRGCKLLKKIDLPSNLSRIEDWTFMQCESLIEINVPSSVVYIGEGAFSFTGINSIELPKQIKIISDNLFNGCSQLQEVMFSNDVYKVGKRAFCGCSCLKNLTLPKGLSIIEDDTFCMSGIETMDIPENVTKLGANAFSRTRLKSITIHNNINSIGDECFSKCDSLSVLTITDDGVPLSIGNKAFLDCRKMNSVNLSRVVSIGDFAFCGCRALSEESFPRSLKQIGERAFVDCRSLTRVDFYSHPNGLSKQTFDGTRLKTVNIHIKDGETTKLSDDPFFNVIIDE